MPQSAPFVLLAGLLLSLTLPGKAVPAEWKGKRVVQDGVVHIMNPAEPMEAPEIYELRELWRLESETPDGELVFGAPRGVQTDPDGNWYVLDTALRTVHVISPDGEYLRSIGRRGEGPGEFLDADMFFTDLDGRIGIADLRARRISYFNRLGMPVGSWRPDSSQASHVRPLHAQPTRHGLIVSYRSYERHGSALTLRTCAGAFNPQGQEVARLLERSKSLPLDKSPVFDEAEDEPISTFCTDQRGRLYISPTYSEYSIHVLDANGTTLMVIHREFDHLGRTPAQIAEAEDILRGAYSEWRGAAVQVRDSERDILALAMRSDHLLWVETSRGWLATPSGIALVADLFDPDGRFVRQVYLRGQVDGWDDFLTVVGDRALRITSGVASQKGVFSQPGAEALAGGDGENAPVIICYQLLPEHR